MGSWGVYMTLGTHCWHEESWERNIWGKKIDISGIICPFFYLCVAASREFNFLPTIKKQKRTNPEQ